MSDKGSEYRLLADQADRLGEAAATSGIKAAWSQIAAGFRSLARLQEAALRRARDQASDNRETQQ